MRCPACGRDVPDASRFCAACGERLASASDTATVSAGDRPPSSDSLDGARFTAGAMLAGRYRIVGLLGRGGMGEVYRAEDLKLGQAVALKFLPPDLVGRADRLARLYQEVRVAREVTHASVCRVHDIVESDGEHFLSMEYIDGENLASLLRRIGRLPQDKALEVARQICAGLAAAHDRGVLHRDLKPANVLIDGHGRAKIADFGLADLADNLRASHGIAGTPAYMAPEQLAGATLTKRTDVYALGLVLHEMFTGRRAQDGSVPSTHLPDLDPAIERVILRCLERDSARRPASALAVAAALPGGNPLAAAIARGETPSPDAVAAGGDAGTLSPAVAVACLAGVIAGMLALAPFSRELNLIGLTTIDQTPAALTERAHAVARSLGYTAPAAEEAVGYTSDGDYLQHIDEHDRSPRRWRALAADQPAALRFWYRRSSRPLVPLGGTDIVTPQNPPPTQPGMLSLSLDQKGRLVSFLAAPAQRDDARSTPPGWNALLAEAGFTAAQLSPAAPQRTPPVFADARAAWTAAYPDGTPIRIEAAAASGQTVYFEIVAPWTRASNGDSNDRPTSGDRAGLAMRGIIQPAAFAFAMLLAYRNLRLGRGDRRGAMRLGVFLLAAGGLSNALATGDLKVITRGPTIVLFIPAALWLFYIALEPHMRRIWPEVMIGWSRLLAGGVRDPLVGRDILAGVMLGVGAALVIALRIPLQQQAGRPPGFPIGASAGDPFLGVPASSDLLLGGRFAASRIIGSLVSFQVLFGTMMTFLALLALYAVLRRRWLAVAGMIVLLTLLYVRVHAGWLLVGFGDVAGPSPANVAVFAALETAAVLAAVRFGLLTMVIASFVSLLLTIIPVTIGAPAPYAASSYLVAATVVALAAYGCWTSITARD